MHLSDAKRLFAPVAGKGGSDTEADEHATGDVTFPAQVMPIALDPSPGRGGDQCIKAITRQAHQRKQQTEKGDLERHRAARGDQPLTHRPLVMRALIGHPPNRAITPTR